MSALEVDSGKREGGKNPKKNVHRAAEGGGLVLPSIASGLKIGNPFDPIEGANGSGQVLPVFMYDR